MTDLSSRTSEHPSPDSHDALDVRIASLRAEVDAELDGTRKAMLHYEIGSLLETGLVQPAKAAQEYLAAYNLDPTFRPPLYALTRIFQRRRSLGNLEKLYDAEVRVAEDDTVRAFAQIDRGTLFERVEAEPAKTIAALYEAVLADPAALAPALFLERCARHQEDSERIELALGRRAEHTADPALKSLLYCELGQFRADAGDVEGSLEALRMAIQIEDESYRALMCAERIARRFELDEFLTDCLIRRAELAERAASSNEQDTRIYSVRRFADSKEATTVAVSLLCEAAHVNLRKRNDLAGARSLLERAHALAPEDRSVRYARMLVSELSGNLREAAEDARALVEGGSGRLAAALHFRIAEFADSKGETEAVRTALAAALEADPSSVVPQAMLADLLLDAGAHAEYVEWLKKRPAQTEGVAKGMAHWRVAHASMELLGNFEQAERHYRDALEDVAPEHRAAVFRELRAAAERAGRFDVVSSVTESLLAEDIAEDERSMLLRESYDNDRAILENHAKTTEVLTKALEHEASRAWAPDAARVFAARNRDESLLHRAHLALADRASDDEAAAAHLCGAARALARNGDEQPAIECLRRAIDKVPGHRYAVALLEELLRSQNAADEVVALLRETAESNEGTSAELSLLLAGAAAEASGDNLLAIHTYEEAADRHPASPAPLWSLLRLAEHTGDRALLLSAREALSEREIDTREAGLATLELAEHYDLISGKPELAEVPFREVLPSQEVGAAAAIGLLLLPAHQIEQRSRIAAVERLLMATPEEDQPGLWRELGGTALSGEANARSEKPGVHPEEPNVHPEEPSAGQVKQAEWIKQAVTALPDTLWQAYATLRSAGTSLEQSESRADAWISLGNITDDIEAASDFFLHGIRAKVVMGEDDVSEDAFILAQELVDAAPETAAAAVALDESLEGGDDADARAQALDARLHHASEASRPALQSACGRALISAGRAHDALVALREATNHDRRDFAAWEALRVAAREAERWEEVVGACDELAAVAEGEWRAELLEEAAGVMMDYLGDTAGAEERLRQALAIDPRRPNSFTRLHELVTYREDSRALLDLVGNRIDALDREQERELARLLYEQARLQRAVRDREGALTSIQRLLHIEPEHAGAIALSVEVHASLEHFEDAVQALQKLATIDVPPQQKRIALLGAADFLERKLGDLPGALHQLRKVEELGLLDAALYVRIARVAEQAELYSDALGALDRAAELTSGSERGELHRRAGILRARHQTDTSGAIRSLRKCLIDRPTDLEAAEELAALLVNPIDRKALSEDFESAVRLRAERDRIDPADLRKICQAARWRGDRYLESAILDTLVCLGVATQEELAAHKLHEARTQTIRPDQTTAPRLLQALQVAESGGAYAAFASASFDTLIAADRLEPASFGVGRSELIHPKQPSALRSEIEWIVQLFGLFMGDFYVGGRSPQRIVATPGRKDRVHWIVGRDVRSPLTAKQRFWVGTQAASIQARTLPLINRTPEDAAAALFAMAAAVNRPLQEGHDRPLVNKQRQSLSRFVSRRVRKTAGEIARTIPDGGRGVDTFCRACRLHAFRAGLLVSSNLGESLDLLLSSTPSVELVSANSDTRELLRFWISSKCIELRREMGWSL